MATSQSVRSIQEAKQNARTDSMQQRTLKKGQAALSKSQTPVVPVGSVNGGRNIKIFMNAVVPKTAVTMKLGIASLAFIETTPFAECIKTLVKMWNVVWEGECSESLSNDDLTLRLFGNINILPGSDLVTLGHFYDSNEPLLPADRLKRAPSYIKPGNIIWIYIDAVIEVQKFELRSNVAAPYWVKTDKELKKRKSLGPMLSMQSSKRSRVLTPLVSRLQARIPAGTTKVEFIFGDIKTSKGISSIIWPDLGDAPKVIGYVEDIDFDNGATQNVYKCILDNEEWVGKRFWNLGKTDECVTIAENHQELQLEALRLHQLSCILEDFKDYAKRNKVSIADDIKVTEFKIAIENISVDGKPSPASGITSEEYESVQDKQDGYITWLLEPMRNASTTTKWSGTMDHPQHPTSKVGDTLYAFVHFAYQYMDNTLVFADLQTAKHGCANNGYNILFDVMSHTICGDSGAGDHGLGGIKKWVDEHICQQRCVNLGLKALKVSDEHEGSDDDDADDSEEEDNE
ncbi:hypothetical protein VKT23_018409 [Stygiomarasmius scandens]|uniref:Alpha-type protein kinase domain-containing protein n=1 Tax=Marasmiellus scandens TaxID=2682957 RepID=A0ABR1IR96_9AGAR